MESEFVSVRGAVLIYGDESTRGDHLPLIYVRGLTVLRLLQFPEWREVEEVSGLAAGGRERKRLRPGGVGVVMRGQLTFIEYLSPFRCGIFIT